MSKSYTQCSQQLIATSALGHITTCTDCGHVHLNLNAVTLRFDLDAFRDLVDMLGFAQHKLDTDNAAHQAMARSIISKALRH
jgi:hypothetical protein